MNQAWRVWIFEDDQDPKPGSFKESRVLEASARQTKFRGAWHRGVGLPLRYPLSRGKAMTQLG
jgi:hypothetical protein